MKAKVQSLVKARWLKFKKTEEKPDVNQNPLSNHENPIVNVVATSMERCKDNVYDLTTPMKILILHKTRYLSPGFDNNDVNGIGCISEKICLFHLEANGQSIENYI